MEKNSSPLGKSCLEMTWCNNAFILFSKLPCNEKQVTKLLEIKHLEAQRFYKYTANKSVEKQTPFFCSATLTLYSFSGHMWLYNWKIFWQKN